MQAKPYDILRMDELGTPIWIEAVASLEIAKARVSELAQRSPSEYVIFHSASSKIVAKIPVNQDAIAAT
jgi:hypothetical protein